MTRKLAEKEFAQLCARNNIWAHKFGDVRKCANCGQLVFPKRTSEADEKYQESIVDYLIFVGNEPGWVECKGRLGLTAFPFAEVNQRQRSFMSSWERRGVKCFIFLSFGPGGYPNRGAWLMPWWAYLLLEQDLMENDLRVSVPYTFFQELKRNPWELEWKAGGWSIPRNHQLLTIFPKILELPSLYDQPI